MEHASTHYGLSPIQGFLDAFDDRDLPMDANAGFILKMAAGRAVQGGCPPFYGWARLTKSTQENVCLN